MNLFVIKFDVDILGNKKAVAIFVIFKILKKYVDLRGVKNEALHVEYAT